MNIDMVKDRYYIRKIAFVTENKTVEQKMLLSWFRYLTDIEEVFYTGERTGILPGIMLKNVISIVNNWTEELVNNVEMQEVMNNIFDPGIEDKTIFTSMVKDYTNRLYSMMLLVDLYEKHMETAEIKNLLVEECLTQLKNILDVETL